MPMISLRSHTLSPIVLLSLGWMLLAVGCGVKPSVVQPASRLGYQQASFKTRWKTLSDLMTITAVVDGDFFTLACVGLGRYRLERYDDSLRAMWASQIDIASREHPIRVVKFGSNVALLTGEYDGDSIRAMARVIDPRDGKQLEGMVLDAVEGEFDDEADDEREVTLPYRLSTASHPSHLLLIADEFIQQESNVLRRIRCVTVRPDGRVRSRSIDLYLDRADCSADPFVDSAGTLFLPIVRDYVTLRLLRYSRDGKDVDSLTYSYTAPDPVQGEYLDLDCDLMPRVVATDRIDILAISASEKRRYNPEVIVATFDFSRLSAIALSHRLPTLVAQKLVFEDHIANLHPCILERLADSTILIGAEQRFDSTVTWATGSSGGFGRHSEQMQYASLTSRISGNLLLARYTANGRLLWQTAIRKRQIADDVPCNPEVSVLSRIVGDRIHLLYRDREFEGFMHATVDLNNGTSTVERLLDLGYYTMVMTQNGIWTSDGSVVLPIKEGAIVNSLSLMKLRVATLSGR